MRFWAIYLLLIIGICNVVVGGFAFRAGHIGNQAMSSDKLKVLNSTIQQTKVAQEKKLLQELERQVRADQPKVKRMMVAGIVLGISGIFAIVTAIMFFFNKAIPLGFWASGFLMISEIAYTSLLGASSTNIIAGTVKILLLTAIIFIIMRIKKTAPA